MQGSDLRNAHLGMSHNDGCCNSKVPIRQGYLGAPLGQPGGGVFFSNVGSGCLSFLTLAPLGGLHTRVRFLTKMWRRSTRQLAFAQSCGSSISGRGARSSL